jgi:tRNA (guanine37-N1)-methyltransferase
MTYHIITTQPQIYDSFLKTGLISRGIDKKIIDIKIHNLHDFSFDKRQSIDDTPYGGGAGMVLRVDVMDNAINKIRNQKSEIRKKTKIILLTPQGKKFTQDIAKRLSKQDELIIISGRFEGYDERIRDLVDEEISIGDYVLTSGDLPAMILIDAISRQIPKFIDRKESIIEESFSNGLLEYPQYTRPFEYRGKKIPKILLSGNHAEIAKWRKKEALERTQKRRKELIINKTAERMPNGSKR